MLNKLGLIFDYFKEAFHLNKQNKALYKPQIALIAVKVLLLVFVGVSAYNWISTGNLYSMIGMEDWDFIRFMLSIGLKLLLILLAYGLVSVILEAGLLNMYKKAVTQGYIEAGDFKEGISKYFLRLIAGEVVIGVCYLLLLPFYIIFGLVTLTVGLTLIPIIVGVFLTMWKISLVMNDSGIFAAIKDSFRFAKNNFFPLAVLQIIHWAFVQGASGGHGGGSNFNFPSSRNVEQGVSEGLQTIPGIENAFEALSRVFRVMIAILIPVISIAVIAASVIAMIFEVFFTLALFIAYKNGFVVPEEPVAIVEEAADVSEAPEASEIPEEIEVIENTESLEAQEDNPEGNPKEDSQEVEQ